MDVVKQNQKSGDHSMQIQVNGDYYNIIPPETIKQVIQSFGELAAGKVETRIQQFSDDYLIPRIQNIENGLEAFKDPAFQLLLVQASKNAASSNRTLDYSMLSELMARRFEKKEDIKSNAVIAKAIETVNLIDNDSLTALSVIYFMGAHIRPVNAGIHNGLQLMENTFQKLISAMPLPVNNRWIENLETLQTLKVFIKNIVSMNSFEVMCKDTLSGYLVSGIRKDSEEYSKCIEEMQTIGLPKTLFVDHELNEGYVRLNFVNKTQINDNKLFSPEQQDVLLKLFTETQKNRSPINIDSIFDSYITKNFKCLAIVRDFWNDLPPLELTALGRLLGYINLKRLASECPDMDLEKI